MAVATYTKTGTKATTPAKLDKHIFGVEIKNHELLKSAYVDYLANQRANYAQAKNRGDVRGGGRKPWPQKGTGNARFGSKRNPVWRGGGVAFGPTGNENFARRLSVKARRLALRQALSLAANADKLMIIEDFSIADGKTQSADKLLKKLSVTGNAVLVSHEVSAMTIRATKNLPNAKLVRANQLTVFDVLNADHVIISKNSLDVLEQWLGESK